MIILTIRTDKPESEIGLFNNEEQLAYEIWPAHRQLAETLHSKIRDLLSANDLTLEKLTGIIVYEGPGSFTGLRIGVSVANALAYSLEIPIVGISGDDWIKTGLVMLKTAKKGSYALPDYGAPVFTTQQKK